ncbi:MAG: SdrD B-like domain-containing protein [Acidobacteriota bacterium]
MRRISRRHSKSRTSIFLRLMVLALLATLSAPAAWGQVGPGPFTFFPTEAVNDGRFLSFGCTGIATFESKVSLSINVPADETEFTLSFFDGETSVGGVAGEGFWDRYIAPPSNPTQPPRQLRFQLYRDPFRQASTADLVADWGGNEVNAPGVGDAWVPVPTAQTTMPDNAFWNALITVDAAAESPSGNYTYHLLIGIDGDCVVGESMATNVKLAASAPLTFLASQFGFEAANRAFDDALVLVPDFSTCGLFTDPNFFLNCDYTYDGTFKFFVNVPENATELLLFDGDFDHGNAALSGTPSGAPLALCADTNDPDTSDTYSNFPADFVLSGAENEDADAVGSPQDDSVSDLFRFGEPGDANKVGCVRYEVRDPNGTVYSNPNPSGNTEWEQFRIISQLDTGPADFVAATDVLPSGIWEVDVFGLDMSNLNFWRLDAACSLREGVPACPPAGVVLIGDTVFFDTDGDGAQGPGEPGIPGVRMNLFRGPASGPGSLPAIATVLTGDTSAHGFEDCQRNNTGGGTVVDELGLYCFAVDPVIDESDPQNPIVSSIDYTVQIDPSNFDPGGPLENFGATTASPEQLDTVELANVLTYDFGYQLGSIGDRVWLDADGDGVQDGVVNGDPFEAGINGVTVELRDANDDSLIATDVTAGDGEYLFPNLAPGDYKVVVVTSTLPPGLIQTFDIEPPLDDESSLTLNTGENREDVDFGYRLGSIGDRVWLDADGDGVQDGVVNGDPFEAGINGVTVELRDGNDDSLIATDVTAGDGEYLFTNLAAGDYKVVVVPSTLPAGLVQTFDIEPPLDDEASLTLNAGEDRLDVDFGYRTGLGSIGDRVWTDRDSDGVQDGVDNGDPFEPGINGVTVELRDPVDDSLIATGVTSGDGAYLFEDLDAGDYKVVIVTSTLPEGVSQTFDLDGTLDDETTVPLAGGEDRRDVDFGYVEECLPELDFEQDFEGNALPAGTILSDQLASFGITVSSANPANPPMIFDSANPTGGDDDLGTPNETATPPGPGVGSGGEAGQPGQNLVALGNVLILSEDGDVTDPDDNAGGGTLIFDFANEVRIDRVAILDIDEGMGGTVTAFDGGGAVIGAASMSSSLGNNSVQTVSLGVAGARRLEVFFPGSGAVSGIVFCVDEAECIPKKVLDDFDSASFSNNDGPDNWAAGWIENDPEAGGAGPNAGQVRVGGGFLKLDDYPNTGGQPSLARQVDLTGALRATLRFDFDTSHAVDYDDAVTVEVSSDGGASYTTLEVITGIVGETWQMRNFDITPFISSETRVRFRVSNKYGGSGEKFFVGFTEIDASCDECVVVDVQDDFDNRSFSNNDGSTAWSNDWIENDPQAGGAGPGTGQVQVHDGLLTLDDYPNTGGQPSVAREVNLTGVANATLSFDFITSSGVDYDDAITVEISDDGGATWTTLEVLTGITGYHEGWRDIDITAFASAQTQVRFRVSNKYGGHNELFCLTFVQISSDCDAGAAGIDPPSGGGTQAGGEIQPGGGVVPGSGAQPNEPSGGANEGGRGTGVTVTRGERPGLGR